MESVKDLNMEADDMQGVLSALEGVNRRINPNRSLEKASCHFLMTAIRKTALYMLDP